MYNEVKYSRNIITISDRRTAVFFRNGKTNVCFHNLRKPCWKELRLEINLRTGPNI
jgi:hypothetical protein